MPAAKKDKRNITLLVDRAQEIERMRNMLVGYNWPEDAAELCANNAVRMCEASIDSFVNEGASKSAMIYIQSSVLAANMLVEKFNNLQNEGRNALELLELIGMKVEVPENEGI